MIRKGKTMKRFFIGIFLCWFCFLPALHAAEGKLKIVATTTFNADLVKKIGGDRVEVKSVAPPKFNIHFIQPKPSDIRNLAKADLYVNGGLDLEAWSDPLVEAVGRPEFFRGGTKSLDLSEGVTLLKPPSGILSRSQGDQHLFGNPHYHLNPENVKIMSRTLMAKLKEIDPMGASVYQANEDSFLSEMDRRIAVWKSSGAACSGKEVYAYHDEVVYLTDFLGMRSELYLEPKPGIPPTPKHIEELEAYAKDHAIKAILQTTYFPTATSEALGKRVGAPVVLIAHNVGEISGTDDIFSFYDTDIQKVTEACLPAARLPDGQGQAGR